MNSPPSSSDDRSGLNPESASSAAFEQLHRGLQRWLWKQGWTSLRPIQEKAIAPILDGTHDVLLSAPTAGGKTEAAFLPITSRLATGDAPNLCLCVSPLKALINDQYDRLVDLCGSADIPVWKWHGDVAQGHKKKFLDTPSGVLLITPESLEAHLVRRGSGSAELFGGMLYAVVDELHAFVGSDRGKQLQSLLHRLDLLNGRRIPRVALSATLGDMALAAEFLRPGAGAKVLRIEGRGAGQELKLLQRGYRRRAPSLSLHPVDDDAPSETRDEMLGDLHEIAAHLFRVLRGSDNLIFANSRTNVEILSDGLRTLSERAGVPNEFLPHHGNLSKELREHAEERLKSESQPGNVIATTTLEMGIDVGVVKSIAQIGNPPSVASMRQRLGRSGRKENEPATLRIYVTEEAHAPDRLPQDALRAQTVQSVAMVQLMLDGWVEPPDIASQSLSTLVQQVLALTAQYGGIRASEAWSVLCRDGPFALDSEERFANLLRTMGRQELLAQASDGLLVLGIRGERIVDHYEFYAAFFTPQEFQLNHEGRQLGSLPITKPVTQRSHLVFGGRRWEVVDVDAQARIIVVRPSRGGRPPIFDGGPAAVHDQVRAQMLEVYRSDQPPGFADATAQELLGEGRQYFRSAGLEHRQIVPTDTGCLFFPWVGDKAMNTLELLLGAQGVVVSNDGVSLNIRATEVQIRRASDDLLRKGLPSAHTLAQAVENKFIGKYDEFLPEDLLAQSYASARLDIESAREALLALTADAE